MVFLVASAMYDSNFLGFYTLLNPAKAQSSQAVAGVPFADVTEGAGLAFARGGWDPASTRYAAVLGGGAGVADVDLDGFEDTVLTGGEAEGNRLFLNQRDGTFRDATEAWGLTHRGLCNGVAFGDADQDGDPDLALGCLGELRFYRNDGGRFEDATDAAGLSIAGLCGAEPCLPSSLGWLDLENDRDLDLYVVNNVDHLRGESLGPTQVFPYLAFARAQPSLLFRNDRGRFAEVGEQAGVDNPQGKGLGLLVLDQDADGFADLYVANDLTENRLYLNQRDGTFRDAARALGVNEVKSSMGTDAGDVDGDGDLDLAITNVRGQALTLFRNDGASFAYATREAGLQPSSQGTGWGVVFFDADLDGDLDLAQAVGTFFDPRVADVRDQLFLNQGRGAFLEATAASGDFADEAVSRALLAFDYDRDGDEDLLVANTLGGGARLLRNDLPRGPGAQSLQLRLEGVESNRDAIGARVLAELPDGRTLLREVRSACSYEASCSLVLTLGLGTHGSAGVKVRWPGGTEEAFGTLDAGAHLLRQGAGASVPWPGPVPR